MWRGRLREGVFQRWGDPDRTGSFGLHPCGGEVAASATFGGVTVPGEGRASWFYGTERWSGWQKDVETLTGTQVFSFYPPLWSREGSVTTSSRNPVPVRESWALLNEVAERL